MKIVQIVGLMGPIKRVIDSPLIVSTASTNPFTKGTSDDWKSLMKKMSKEAGRHSKIDI